MLLNAIGDMKPQLVGYNLANADLKILVQMANTSSVKTTKLAKRPYKHQKDYNYFNARNSEGHINLIKILWGFGKSTPSLNEMASICKILSKLGVLGQDVAQLWLAIQLWEIVAYNVCDTLTTYLN